MLVRPLTATAALAMFLQASPALAKIPDPRFSEVPAVLVGCPSGAALPSCGGSAMNVGPRVAGYRVVVRDINNSTLWNERITLDFSRTSIRLLGDEGSGTTVDCAARTISAITGSSGTIVFRPRFSGGCAGEDVDVIVDGFTLRAVTARSTDVDSDGRTGLFDFARVARNFLENSTDPATDFDPCAEGSQGRTTLADFAVFGAELLRDVPPGSTVCP